VWLWRKGEGKKFLEYGNFLNFVMCKLMKIFMENLVDVGDVYWGRGFIYILCVMNY